MKFELAYGERTQSLDVPDKNLLGVLAPNDAHGLRVGEADVAGLRAGLREFAAGARSLLIVVNDYTRPTPNEDILKLIEPEFKDKDFRLIVACGSHVPPNEAQFRQVFGSFYDRYHSRVLVHNGNDRSKLKFVGKTGRGTEAWVNEAVWQADRLITINSVEPHYFAGYTGGRKSILPGISGYDTITQNHRLSLVPEACTLALKGNPVHEDMTDVARMIPRSIFSIQVIIDNKHNLCGIKHGDIFKSFDAAVPDANKVFCIPIQEQADIVVAVSARPYDVNLYQQQKGLQNGKLAVKDGGILIGVSACRDGVGDDTFVKLLSSVKTPAEAIEKIWANFVLGYHKSAKLAEMMVTGEIWNVVPVSDDIVKSIFMTPFPNVQSALAAALARQGPNAKVIVMPDASLTVPLCKAAGKS
jgi:nickel-dependent lactate racemase